MFTCVFLNLGFLTPPKLTISFPVTDDNKLLALGFITTSFINLPSLNNCVTPPSFPIEVTFLIPPEK